MSSCRSGKISVTDLTSLVSCGRQSFDISCTTRTTWRNSCIRAATDETTRTYRAGFLFERKSEADRVALVYTFLLQYGRFDKDEVLTMFLFGPECCIPCASAECCFDWRVPPFSFSVVALS